MVCLCCHRFPVSPMASSSKKARTTFSLLHSLESAVFQNVVAFCGGGEVWSLANTCRYVSALVTTAAGKDLKLVWKEIVANGLG